MDSVLLSGLFTSSSNRRRVKLPVLVYVDNEVVGFGILNYYDYYCDSINEINEYRCYTHKILVDTVEVGVFNMCFTDTLSHVKPGLKTKTLHYDIYINTEKTGYAKIKITDLAGKAYTYTEILTQALQKTTQILYTTTLTTLLQITQKLRKIKKT